jgi:hypothetical protein
MNTLSVLSPPGLVSIVMPCVGMLEYTRLCVPNVLAHTRDPFELIFLDIGSLDGTAEYLAGLRQKEKGVSVSYLGEFMQRRGGVETRTHPTVYRR